MCGIWVLSGGVERQAIPFLLVYSGIAAITKNELRRGSREWELRQQHFLCTTGARTNQLLESHECKDEYGYLERVSGFIFNGGDGLEVAYLDGSAAY